MMKNKTLIILLLFFFLTGINKSVNAQLHKTIDSLQAIEQTCLDSGRHMENCSCKYRYEMDSILNVVYNNIRSDLNTQQKEKLKQEELTWLKKRELHHEKSREDAKQEGLGGSDVGMVACDEDAKFIINRIYSIIKKWDYKKIYSQ